MSRIVLSIKINDDEKTKNLIFPFMSQGLKVIQFIIPNIPEKLTREIENLLSLTPIPDTIVKERSMFEEGQTLRVPELRVFAAF
jgi:hypothetical protein